MMAGDKIGKIISLRSKKGLSFKDNFFEDNFFADFAGVYRTPKISILQRN